MKNVKGTTRNEEEQCRRTRRKTDKNERKGNIRNGDGKEGMEMEKEEWKGPIRNGKG